MVYHIDDLKLIQLDEQTVGLDQQNVTKTLEALVRSMQSRECEVNLMRTQGPPHLEIFRPNGQGHAGT